MSLLEQYIGLMIVLAVCVGMIFLGRKPKDDGPYMTQDELEHIRILQAALRDYRRKCHTRYHVEQRRKA